jgi:hypothetical protein
MTIALPSTRIKVAAPKISPDFTMRNLPSITIFNNPYHSRDYSRLLLGNNRE